jgi:hypothetical protein
VTEPEVKHAPIETSIEGIRAVGDTTRLNGDLIETSYEGHRPQLVTDSN